MNARQAFSSIKKRRWLALPVLALLIIGGMIVYPEPKLQPVAQYKWPRSIDGSPLLFSAQGMGYPAIGAVVVKGNRDLAFTADGKYLSWAIDDGTGVRLFVFRVPEAR